MSTQLALAFDFADQEHVATVNQEIPEVILDDTIARFYSEHGHIMAEHPMEEPVILPCNYANQDDYLADYNDYIQQNVK